MLVIRPLSGVFSFVGADASRPGRAVIGFFGIRGIGSFYYLAHGLNQAPFGDAELVWAITGAVVITSIVVHGITASPVVAYITPE